MGSINKAIAAAAGGAVLGTAAVPFMPEGTPWYGYLAAYAITIIVPAIITYLAPKNS
jgi:putative flippase GtrA